VARHRGPGRGRAGAGSDRAAAPGRERPSARADRVLSFPIVLSHGPPAAAGLARVAEAGVTMIRTGHADWNE